MTGHGDAEEYADLLVRAAPFLTRDRARSGAGYGRAAVTGDAWLRRAAEPYLRGLPALPDLVETEMDLGLAEIDESPGASQGLGDSGDEYNDDAQALLDAIEETPEAADVEGCLEDEE